MPRLIYTVCAAFADTRVRDEFERWLRDGHADAVIDAGAISAEIVRLDAPGAEPPARIEVRYRFPDRAAFDRYERTRAAALRAEGAALFSPQRGVRMSRRVGELTHEVGLCESGSIPPKMPPRGSVR